MDCTCNVELRVIKGKTIYLSANNVQILKEYIFPDVEEKNIEVMKIADFMSNTQKGTNYNLTDEEYKEAHKELQVLIKKQMYGGGDE